MNAQVVAQITPKTGNDAHRAENDGQPTAQVIDLQTLYKLRQDALLQKQQAEAALAQTHGDSIKQVRADLMETCKQLGLTVEEVVAGLVKLAPPPAPASIAAATAPAAAPVKQATSSGKSKRNPNPPMKYSFTDGADTYYWGGAGFPNWAKKFPQILSEKGNSIDKAKVHVLTEAEQAAYKPENDAAKKS